eukprot:CAMPEP_0204342500 /NCGR_PEP_ID=MMETSP0469-20131031/24192_1 /ASSEMBLY_ACC=CAM_ASM_000384 /TAXON_ID=2969 /ORGANISM="Oxyrrhis marina" /LENGTH=69 /DNA_ID=CAMNT_0051327411 /DNA_START=38 /DNA_END=244 /DNA_ORIENTATION=-
MTLASCCSHPGTNPAWAMPNHLCPRSATHHFQGLPNPNQPRASNCCPSLSAVLPDPNQTRTGPSHCPIL